MYKRSMKLIVGSIALLLCVSLSLLAGEAEKDKAQGVQKTTTNDLYSWFTINNLFNWYGNNGNSSYNIATANSGLEFPKGSGQNPIFEDGVVWGGFHKGRTIPKVGGSTYRYGLQAGPIITVGTATTDPVAADPLNPSWKVYRVRRDVTPTTTFAEVQAKMEEESDLISRYSLTSAQAVFADYQSDWANWPAKDGFPAPFEDKNGNGRYEPAVDIPGQPGADQTLYYVANDMSVARLATLVPSPPIGVEMHRTVWGYNLSGALGNTIFASTLVINKSGAVLDSAFMVQWSDPDLGESGDDYAGCDVERSLGYIYNGLNVDNIYGVPVPAAGYDFFQGPLVQGLPGDSGVFMQKYRKGYRNLGMSTFVFFINGSAVYTDPPLGSVGADVQWYRLMNGLISSTGAPFVNPITGEAVKYTLDGDPVSGKGWLDGTYGLTPGDRRICLVTGPFDLANGDTQEVVTATIVGQGSDRISSIAVLRWYSDLAQSAYNGLFDIPRPAPNPVLDFVQLDGEVSFSWPDSSLTPGGFVNIETWNSAGYQFEGYNVYQLPSLSPDVSLGARLATYDIINSVTTVFDDVYDATSGYVLTKPVHFGTDSGIKRTFSTKQDAIRGTRLLNGSTYYFALTTYSFNPSPTAKPTQLESSPVIITVIPQSPVPGTKYSAENGEILEVTQTVAPGGSLSEGQVLPMVVDPSALTGHTYKVTFRVDTTSGNTVWDLTDVTLNRVLLKGNENQSGDDVYPIIDGMMVKVTGPALPGMKDWAVGSTGVRHITWVDGTGFGLEGFELTIGNAYDHWFSGSTVGYDKMKNVEIRFATADGTWDPRADQSAATNFSKAYRYLRGATAAAANPSFAPWIVNATAGYAFQEFNWSVPFAAYDIEASPPRRLAVGHLENNTALGLVDGRYWPRVNGTYPSGTTNVGATGPREWFFIFDVNYSTTQDPVLAKDILNNTVPMMWMGTVSRRSSAPNFVNTSTFTIIASHINTANNTFTWTAPAPTVGDNALAAQDVERVNVYPNPYIGYNAQEVNKYQRFVTFTHLPDNAIIRVFNLAGVLVRTMKKEGGGQFYQWDMQNEDGFPVAAGMYVVYIDMPDLGKTKTLKLGVIPEQQFIDKW